MHILLCISHLNVCQIIYPIGKGQYGFFHTWTDLISFKHQTKVKVQDAKHVCEEVMKEFNTTIASIPVNNAARSVAAQVCNLFPDLVVLVICDPSHCVDLCSKDMATLPVVKRVMGDAKEVR